MKPDVRTELPEGGSQSAARAESTDADDFHCTTLAPSCTLTANNGSARWELKSVLPNPYTLRQQKYRGNIFHQYPRVWLANQQAYSPSHCPRRGEMVEKADFSEEGQLFCLKELRGQWGYPPDSTDMLVGHVSKEMMMSSEGSIIHESSQKDFPPGNGDEKKLEVTVLLINNRYG